MRTSCLKISQIAVGVSYIINHSKNTIWQMETGKTTHRLPDLLFRKTCWKSDIRELYTHKYSKHFSSANSTLHHQRSDIVHAEYRTPVDQTTITRFGIAKMYSHTSILLESITLMNDGCYSSGYKTMCFSQTVALPPCGRLKYTGCQ